MEEQRKFHSYFEHAMGLKETREAYLEARRKNGYSRNVYAQESVKSSKQKALQMVEENPNQMKPNKSLELSEHITDDINDRFRDPYATFNSVERKHGITPGKLSEFYENGGTVSVKAILTDEVLNHVEVKAPAFIKSASQRRKQFEELQFKLNDQSSNTIEEIVQEVLVESYEKQQRFNSLMDEWLKN
ncbi:unnamed protein product [Ambrosiozyma monospora]|uniref:Unnamed protein product n=1 Tax=Ambrosiozyma monospora TaxID=43982 RepID=A0ACB5SRC1_AMBMO|nr:unnamed protein product [Ambrosiozyma monospora]